MCSKSFNTREQQINIVKPIHTNKGQYSQNPFISSNINQNKSINTFNYEFSSNQSNNNNNSNNINLDSTYNFNNTITNNNNSSYSSNNSRIFNQKVEEQINRESNNSRNMPSVMRNNININSNINVNNIILSKQYEEDINNNNILNNNNNIFNNNKSKRFTYQTNNDINNINNINNNYNNDFNYNRKRVTNMQDQEQYLELKQRLPSDEISDNELNKNNLNNNIQNYNNEINNNNNSIYNQEIFIKSQRKSFLNNGENNIEENNIRQRDQDEISTFSFFSAFNNFKNYPFYKNRKFIFVHTIILLLILCFTIAILQLITYSWDSITDLFSSFFELLTDPVRLIEIIASFFSSIFFGAINYYYITIPLLIFAFIGYLHLKQYLFRRKIRELLNKIIKDLDNNTISNENRAISEDNIYEKYVKNSGVSYREFVKKYIPVMKKLQRNEPRLRLSSIIINGKQVVFWELYE